MTVEYLNPPDLMKSPAFSHAVVVTHPTRTLYVGGQNGADASGAIAGDFAQQTAKAIENVGTVLAAAGGQFTDVISWTIAVAPDQDLRAGFAAVQPALADRPHPPIVTVLQVSALAVPGALVEISAIAVLP